MIDEEFEAVIEHVCEHWLAKREVHDPAEVEEKYGLPPGFFCDPVIVEEVPDGR
jgi:hypothetical protein